MGTVKLSLAGPFTRRRWLAGTTAGLFGSSVAGWLDRLAAAEAGSADRKRSCLLLWMNGGPSQTDTFDLKPGHANGGPFQPIDTSVPGLQISEHLPKIARWADRLAVVRSMSTIEGDHGRAREHLRTGYQPQGAIQFPVFGSLVSHEHGPQRGELPHYVSILPQGLFRPGIPPAGFLGPDHAPLVVGRGADDGGQRRLEVENIARAEGVSPGQARDRLALLRAMERDFLDARPGAAAAGHRSAYTRADRLMSPEAARVFNLDGEPAAVQDAYGRSAFGQGCLLARRLIEHGVPFVEVTLGGWDTHQDNFNSVRNQSGVLDAAWSALLADLSERSLLESTLVVWMGEFGRTPVINPRVGRDHYPKAWSVVLGGGGVRGGQAVGRTSADGLTVEDRPVSTPDFLATVCLALGLDPLKQNVSNVARPIRLVDPAAKPLREILHS